MKQLKALFARSLRGVNPAHFIALVLLAPLPQLSAAPASFRPPSVPLAAHDPYFSIWSPADRLTDAWPVHWTGKRHALQSMARIDGKTFRLMGPEPASAPALPQQDLQVLPTRTVYTFQNERVQVVLTFLTPALPGDMDLVARPVTYLVWEVKSLDGRSHEVSLYQDTSAELAVNTPDQEVVWSREKIPDLEVLRTGSKAQAVLRKKGDDLRIDWGYAYAAAPKRGQVRSVIADAQATRDLFAGGQNLSAQDDSRMPRPVRDGWPVMAFQFDLGKVGAKSATRMLMLAYDDLYSIKFMGQQLRPYWKRKGASMEDILKIAARDHAKLARDCEAFDKEFMADLEKAGGEKYARLCALAYRQCLAGNKLAADANGQPLLFPKENFSNGCIGTVDVIYPMAPFFLLFGPDWSKAMLAPIMEYAKSERWKFPFAPHDLGTYPHATGQVYGGGERTEENQMPVEESGNMLILVGALAQMEGKADFAKNYWPQLTQWAEYLKSKGLDPENQLCTDDFAGHLAHNVNLSAKAILGLGAYARLCEMAGKTEAAQAYRQLAENYARQWEQKAANGEHYRLAFDKPGTWSQKYNLVWDRLLGFNLFPAEVTQKEMRFYRKMQKTYGLPLDNRSDYTKLDWITWTATLTGSREDFEALVNPVYDFLQATPDRVPMTDWYWTTTAKKQGFQARPVIGGVFIKLLDDAAIWTKWAKRGGRTPGQWAPLPESPKYREFIPTAQKAAVMWRYTMVKPADDWSKPGFDDSGWRQGKAGFGTAGTPGAIIGTEWKTSDIWLRREFVLTEEPPREAQLLMHHDENAQVYLNGILAAEEIGYTSAYELAPMNIEGRAALKKGKVVMAVHCHQTSGGQYIDVGLVGIVPAGAK